MTEELKPCPFCGGPPKASPQMFARGPRWGIMSCDADHSFWFDIRADTKSEAIAAWNARPEPINSAALDGLAQIDRGLIEVPVEDRLFPTEAWQELIEYDDRTSPAEYPDRALITFDELASFMARAHPNECTCCDVVGENPGCVVHGALAGEMNALEAEVERQEGLVKVYRQAQLTAEEKLCRAEADAMGQKRRAKHLEETIAALREKVAGLVEALDKIANAPMVLDGGSIDWCRRTARAELAKHQEQSDG